MGKEPNRVSYAAAEPRDLRDDVARASRDDAERAFRESLDRSSRRDPEHSRRDQRASKDDDRKADSPRDLKRLEWEIKRTRRRLDEYVSEIDRRRHRLLAVREHPWAAAGAALGAVGLAVGIVVLVRRRAATRRRVRTRSTSLREAFGRMLDHPERIASEGKSPWSRVLVAVAPIVVKKVADAALRRRRTRA
ncbi:MAG TPA: hypothetical protein VH854_12615 [Thermoanaerobaculia bacterium]|nr:hypothetical protein [Thermoanaerobaculia bacterium]